MMTDFIRAKRHYADRQTRLRRSACNVGLDVGLRRQQGHCDIALRVTESNHNVLVKRKGL